MNPGDFQLIPLLDGRFRLDGGAMFGVVPKPLWSRRTPADDRNRIPMSLRPLLIRAGRQNQPPVVGKRESGDWGIVAGERDRRGVEVVQAPGIRNRIVAGRGQTAAVGANH